MILGGLRACLYNENIYWFNNRKGMNYIKKDTE
jgi:hypothetical protein